MEKRDLSLGVPVTGPQWEIVSRTAHELGVGQGFEWRPQACHEIEVYMRAEDCPTGWENWVAGDGKYGAEPVRAATFLWNDGDPYARNDLTLLPEPPNVLPQDDVKLQAMYEKWVHHEWQRLWHESGIPYVDAGNVTQV